MKWIHSRQRSTFEVHLSVIIISWLHSRQKQTDPSRKNHKNNYDIQWQLQRYQISPSNFQKTPKLSKMYQMKNVTFLSFFKITKVNFEVENYIFEINFIISWIYAFFEQPTQFLQIWRTGNAVSCSVVYDNGPQSTKWGAACLISTWTPRKGSSRLVSLWEASIGQNEDWRPLKTAWKTKWPRPKTTGGGRWTRKTWWSTPGTWSSRTIILIIQAPLQPLTRPQWLILPYLKPMLDPSPMKAKSK